MGIGTSSTLKSSNPLLSNCFWPYKMLVCRANLTTFVFMIKLASGMPGNIVYAISGIPDSSSHCGIILKTYNVFLELMLFASKF